MGSEWRPIETAPKDGTRILGFSPKRGYGQRETFMTKLTTGEPAGWIWQEPFNNWTVKWMPTHWMPLPEPPGGDDGRG